MTAMGKAVFEGVGTAVAGPEENYLLVFDGDRRDHIGVAELLQQAGGGKIAWEDSIAFHYSNPDGHYERKMREYRETANKRFPPLYRVRITVELEPLTEEETEEKWRAAQVELVGERYDAED